MILAKGVSYYQQEALRKAREGHTHLPIAVTATRLGDGTYKVLSYLADDVWRFPNAIFHLGLLTTINAFGSVRFQSVGAQF